MQITANINDNGTVKLTAARLNITTDLVIDNADELAAQLCTYVADPYMSSQSADTYQIGAHDTGVKITTSIGAFDLPWQWIANVVEQLHK